MKKKIICALAVIIIIIAAMIAGRSIFKNKKTPVVTYISPDTQFSVAINETGVPGWPFGKAKGTIELFDSEGKRLRGMKIEAVTDGGKLTPEDFTVCWLEDRVTVTVCAEEKNTVYSLFYFSDITMSSAHTND